MKNLYDVQQLLRRFGIFVYTGNRRSDIDLIELEVTELFRAKLISTEDFAKIKYILQKEYPGD